MQVFMVFTMYIYVKSCMYKTYVTLMLTMYIHTTIWFDTQYNETIGHRKMQILPVNIAIVFCADISFTSFSPKTAFGFIIHSSFSAQYAITNFNKKDGSVLLFQFIVYTPCTFLGKERIVNRLYALIQFGLCLVCNNFRYRILWNESDIICNQIFL